LAEKETMPVIVRDLDDDAATIIMVDSNLQRESLLPSERAFAYKMKLEAMKHQGERVDLTCAQVGHKSDGRKSRDILAEQVGQSKNQIQRFIRLTELIPELLDMVDEKKIALNPAYELSFLKKEEQVDLIHQNFAHCIRQCKWQLVWLRISQADCQASLRVPVNQKHFLSGLCQTYSQVRTGCCFANAAFLVGDGDDLRVQINLLLLQKISLFRKIRMKKAAYSNK
jgi:hypothetical protein